MLFNPLLHVTLVANKLRRQWFTLSLETNCIRQPARQAQIISQTVLGTSAKSLQLHFKVVMEIFMPLMTVLARLWLEALQDNLALLPLLCNLLLISK